MGGFNLGDALGGLPFGLAGAALSGAGVWNPSKQFGNPGHTNWRSTPWQDAPGEGYDPSAFQGQWNGGSGPFTLNGLAAGAAAAPNQQSQGYSQALAGQTGLANSLMGEANGTAPSVAQTQLAQNTQTNMANQMAASAQNAGNNPAMAGYQAAQQGGNLSQQMAGQAATAGIQEREGAQGLLSNVYGQMGQQGQNQQQIQNQMVQYFTSQGMSAEQAQQMANIAQQQLLAGSYNASQGLNAGINMGNSQNSANLIGGIIGGVGQAGGSIMSALGLAHGGVVPGPDRGVDEHEARLRGQEVVVPPESPVYPMARKAMAGRIVGGSPASQPQQPWWEKWESLAGSLGYEPKQTEAAGTGG